MRWHLSRPDDPAVRILADRHYSRQTPGAARFVQSGVAVVLKVPGGRLEWCVRMVDRRLVEAEQVQAAQAGWVTHAPIAAYVRHAWAGAWVNQFFHNESPVLASVLIRQAIAATRSVLGSPPALGIVTMIDPQNVRQPGAGERIGQSYVRAGFRLVGETKSMPKKLVFQLLPADMPEAESPVRIAVSQLPLETIPSAPGADEATR